MTEDLIEYKILGILLTCEDPKLCKEIVKVCSYKYFGKEGKKIFGVIKQSLLKNNIVVIDRVKDVIEKYKLENYFQNIINADYEIDLHGDYVNHIKNNYVNDRLKNIIKASNEQEKSVLIKELSEDVGGNTDHNIEVLDFTKMATNFFGSLDDEVNYLKTYEWLNFNKMLHIEKQDLIVIAGRPAMGKTAYSLSLALQLAKNKHHGIFFSLEMSPAQLFKRSLSQLSGIPLSKFNRDGIMNFTDDEDKNLTLAKNEMSKLNDNFKVVSGNFTIELIKQQIEIVSQFKQLDYIMIDYLQLIKPENNSSRYEAITEISMELKRIAKKYNITVFALAQLSRATETRPDKRPILSDMKESGQTEQDASVVIGLYREYYYDPEKTDRKNALEAMILKNRNGETGTITNYCNLSIQQIRE